MSAYANQVKSYIERYQTEVGGDGMLDPHAVAEWAYRNGLHKPSIRTVVDAIAADIAQQFREEYRTDAKGQRYRAMHAVRSKKGDKTMSLTTSERLVTTSCGHLHSGVSKSSEIVTSSKPTWTSTTRRTLHKGLSRCRSTSRMTWRNYSCPSRTRRPPKVV
jgi:hypothetical protein